LLGAACAVVGVVLTLRPFTSLGALVLFVMGAFLITGVSELFAARDLGNPAPAVLAGVGWIAAGVAVVIWAASTIQALAIVVGISMLLGGLSRVTAAIRGRVDDRLIAADRHIERDLRAAGAELAGQKRCSSSPCSSDPAR
jgi:uncharacterized membrane protein HdeD (DUF308 family)